MTTGSTEGRILVATPTISDGVFDQAVVFILHHDPVGALGVIINQPSELAIEELLPRWSALTTTPGVVFGGGPVEPNGFIAVAKLSAEARRFDAAEIVSPVADTDIASLDLDADPALAAPLVDRLRIFRGYSGWGPGQLDAELAHGAWFDLKARPDDLWTTTPEDLYQRVLKRQTGTVAWFANAPVDPSVN